MEFKIKSKKKEEEIVEEVVEESAPVMESAPIVEKPKKKEPVKVEPKRMNELEFRKGDEFELKGLSFKVEEVHGVKIVLKRIDI